MRVRLLKQIKALLAEYAEYRGVSQGKKLSQRILVSRKARKGRKGKTGFGFTRDSTLKRDTPGSWVMGPETLA